jgi:iron(III) transport system substrate-binding protein
MRGPTGGRRSRLLVLGALLVSLAACRPAAGPAETAPAPTGATDTAAAEWDRLVQAARAEGQVTVSGQASDTWRQFLTSFEKDYPGIRIEYTGTPSRDFWARALREREIGQYLWDVRIGGVGADVFQAKADGLFDPVRPLLVLPDVADPQSWWSDLDTRFYDHDKQFILAFVANEFGLAYVNRDILPESELQSMPQLVDPRWKGRIALLDPRGGAGQGALTGLHIAFGDAFVRDLLTTAEPVVTGDNRQQAEWLIRGRYPIGIGASSTYLIPFWREGIGQNVKPLKGVNMLVSSSGTIQVMSQRPHPRATALFVNWLLSRPAQERMAQVVGMNSWRRDVPPGLPEDAIDQSRLGDYLYLTDERYESNRRRVEQLSREPIH